MIAPGLCEWPVESDVPARIIRPQYTTIPIRMSSTFPKVVSEVVGCQGVECGKKFGKSERCDFAYGAFRRGAVRKVMGRNGLGRDGRFVGVVGLRLWVFEVVIANGGGCIMLILFPATPIAVSAYRAFVMLFSFKMTGGWTDWFAPEVLPLVIIQFLQFLFLPPLLISAACLWPRHRETLPSG